MLACAFPIDTQLLNYQLRRHISTFAMALTYGEPLGLLARTAIDASPSKYVTPYCFRKLACGRGYIAVVYNP
jgi:hypothetical protein